MCGGGNQREARETSERADAKARMGRMMETLYTTRVSTSTILLKSDAISAKCPCRTRGKLEAYTYLHVQYSGECGSTRA